MTYRIDSENSTDRAKRLKREGRWEAFKAMRSSGVSYDDAAMQFPPLDGSDPSCPEQSNAGGGGAEVPTPQSAPAPKAIDKVAVHGDISHAQLARDIYWCSQALGQEDVQDAPNLLCASLYNTYRHNQAEFFKTLFSKLVSNRLEVEDIGSIEKDKSRVKTDIEAQVLAAAAEAGAAIEEGDEW